MSSISLSIRSSWPLAALLAVFALLLPAHALAAAPAPVNRQPVSALGSLSQLSGSSGCLVDRSQTGSSV